MEKRAIITLVVGLASATPHAPAAELPGRIAAIEHHTAACFAPGTPVNCEVSAVVESNGKLLLANDKRLPAPGGPALFTLDIEQGKISGEPTVLPGKALREADKYEALTKTLDGRYMIASTAFNKAGTDEDPSSDILNTILYWPVDDPEAAKPLSPTSRSGVTSSISLREQIEKAIGASYYQIEAITMAPSEPAKAKTADGQLIIGIRRHGNDKTDAHFGFTLISAHVKFKEGTLALVEAFKSVQNFNVQAQGHTVGLSGIEYDRFNKDRLYAVTSYEEKSVDAANKPITKIGGFLWVVPFAAGKPGTPQLVTREDGSTLRFSNKPEGVEVLDAHQIIVVHDDDRVEVQTSEAGIERGANEFAYSKIRFP
ncbi:hypothetical protein ACIPZC_06500 [Pseudomonas sp. NPDC089743]|uniref:hypothetical protein n=1 Tax=Pseudomonas sp. NPDC089743 TaxID=3364471 RepID=UPI0038055D37